jgi:hypothetical protein
MSFRSNIRGLLIAAAIAVPMLTLPTAQAQISIGISVGFAPPVMPVYAQPPIPGDGYIWTPGYWGYTDDDGYFWVPGTWVLAPEPGGGEWRGGHFFYNGAVANFGGWHPTNVYVDRDVIVHNTIVNPGHASFNGPGGIDRQPSPQERQFANERHIAPTANQVSHQTAASQDRSQLASVNHGRPGTTATSNVGAYHAVAQQHAQSQPISSADRAAGKSPNSTMGSRAQAAPKAPKAPKNRPAPKQDDRR